MNFYILFFLFTPGWPHARPQSVEFHQQRHSFHGNNAGSFPTQEHPQRNQGMNRQPSLSASSPRAAPRGPVQNKMKRKEPFKQSHSPRANSYKGPPLVARQAIEIQGLNSKQVSESPAPFSYTTTEVSGKLSLRLRESITHRTPIKLIILNRPLHPTGKMVTKK